MLDQGPFHKYPDIFENKDFFPSVFEKLRFHMLKQWKDDCIPHRACVMLVVYDVSHYRIWKPPFSSVFTKSQSFWKDAVFFGDRLRRMRVDDRPDRRKNLRFQNKNGYVWTGPQGDVTPGNSQRRFLTQHSVAMLEQCWNYSKQCRNNIAKLCCAKNHGCESFRVTSP